MGAVWLADHAGLQTQVVVKFMIGNLGVIAIVIVFGVVAFLATKQGGVAAVRSGATDIPVTVAHAPDSVDSANPTAPSVIATGTGAHVAEPQASIAVVPPPSVNAVVVVAPSSKTVTAPAKLTVVRHPDPADNNLGSGKRIDTGPVADPSIAPIPAVTPKPSGDALY